MEYKCQTTNMSRMIVSSIGFFNPICEKCNTQDCSNPIEKRKISIMGVTKIIKVYGRGSEPRFVTHCEGFMI